MLFKHNFIKRWASNIEQLNQTIVNFFLVFSEMQMRMSCFMRQFIKETSALGKI